MRHSAFQRRFTFAFVFGAFLFGVAITGSHGIATETNSEMPTWVTSGPGQAYPLIKYLVGVGSGKTRQEAETDAKRVIAEVFRSEVKSQLQKQAQSTMEQDTAGKIEGKDVSQVNSQVSVQSDMLLRGVEIKERYVDSKSGLNYALAVIDKQKARNLHALDLKKLSDRLESLKRSFDRKPSSPVLSEIGEKLQAFDRLNEEYSILNQGMMMPRPIDTQSYEGMREKLSAEMSKFRVLVKYSGSRDEFSDAFESCLSDKDIKLALSEDETASHVVELSMSEKEEPISVEGWKKFRYSANAKVMAGKKVLSKINVRRAEQGRNDEQAFQKVKPALVQDICDKTEQALTK